ncbi:MAG: type II toxin-antitoxin system VapC family toxin [Acidobacteriia bacterium]|nr:type II toxin-antitoxin system VapC family toxin [Terriglobia bacterium]
MTELVLDASVATKWAVPGILEPLAEQADDLLRQYTDGQINLLVPDLFWSEIANALWKAARRGRISAETADDALAEMIARDFPTIPSRDVLDRALTIAVQFDRSVYDSLYVALAVARKTQLITADERLANALAARLPVKWLGAF